MPVPAWGVKILKLIRESVDQLSGECPPPSGRHGSGGGICRWGNRKSPWNFLENSHSQRCPLETDNPKGRAECTRDGIPNRTGQSAATVILRSLSSCQQRSAPPPTESSAGCRLPSTRSQGTARSEGPSLIDLLSVIQRKSEPKNLLDPSYCKIELAYSRMCGHSE